MKYKGDYFRLESERNKELYEIYQKLYFEEGKSMDEIADAITDMPARRFYLDETRAAVVISQMAKGKILVGSNMHETKRRMYREVFLRAKKLRRTMPKDTPLKAIANIVVHQPAPSFYMGKEAIKRTLYRIIRGWYKQRKKEQGRLP